MKQLRILTSNSKLVVVFLAMALLFNVAAASAQSYSVLYDFGKHTVPQPNPRYFGLMIEGWDANGNSTQGGAVRFNFSLQVTSRDWNVVSEYAWSPRLFSIAPIGGHTGFQSAGWDSLSHSSSGRSLTMTQNYNATGNVRSAIVAASSLVNDIWLGGTGPVGFPTTAHLREQPTTS
jgi:hypothetical protein